MSNSKEYAYSDIEMRAEVFTDDGETILLELSSFDMNFMLDGIPTARMTVAVGSNYSTDPKGATADIHEKAKKIDKRSKVQVYAKINGVKYKKADSADEERWPDAPFLVFDGYINKPSYRRGDGAASLMFTADHWISDLANTSKLSPTLHPRSGADMFRQAQKPSTTGLLEGHGIEPVNVLEDVWGNGIKYIFKELAGQNLINWEKLDMEPVVEDKNEKAIAALKRMDDSDSLGTPALPLQLRNVFNDVRGIKDLALTGLTNGVVHIDTGSTVWDTLLNLRDKYQYGIIVTVETATVAPLIPIAGEALYKTTIGTDEYGSIESLTNPELSGLPIRGVVLSYVDDLQTFSGEGTICVDGAAFDIAKKNPDKSRSYGQFIIHPAPYWITPTFVGDNNAEEGQVYAPQCNIQPRNKNNPEGETSASKPIDGEAVEDACNKIGKDYAKSIYINEVFRNRRCSITGRLRFDLAPGSLVKLKLLGENIPGYADDSFLWGMVEGISTSISAEAGNAGTSLVISHLHTEKERSWKELVDDRHPMYTSAWSGAKLINL